MNKAIPIRILCAPHLDDCLALLAPPPASPVLCLAHAASLPEVWSHDQFHEIDICDPMSTWRTIIDWKQLALANMQN